MYMYVCVLLAVLVHGAARRGHFTPWNWSYIYSWNAIWVLEIQLQSPERAGSSLNQ